MSHETVYMEEYKSLRQEILTKLSERLELNRWGLIWLGVIYSYILANPERAILLWVPVVLSIALIAHFNEEHRMVDCISVYIKEQLEGWAAGGRPPQGWETYKRTLQPRRWWKWWQRWPTYLWDWTPVPIWILIFLITLGIAVVMDTDLLTAIRPTHAALPSCGPRA
ncbi:MAG TPA: hypothetical protein VGC77_22645 [Rhodopseudomonas sp.]|uniref:hypothetical protein n=1 Tax=Rhodopseudomonas sp. TaxID=1078 RepID=UPI002EDB42DF